MRSLKIDPESLPWPATGVSKQGLQAKYGPPPIFVNKALLRQNPTQLFTIVYGAFEHKGRVE